MIVHLFNSSSVSGPERLVLPALAGLQERFVIVNLREERIARLRESDPLEIYARSLNLPYYDVRVCGQWDHVAMRDLCLLLRRLNPVLAHAHDVKASAYLQQAKQALTDKNFPIVSTHHGVEGRPDWKTKMFELFYRMYLLNKFDRVCCVSCADYEILARSGIPKGRLRLHLNGIEGRLVPLEQRAVESRRIRPAWLPDEMRRDDLFLMGVIGRLMPEKDHDRLIKVLALLNRLPGVMDWRCLIFGTGPLEKKLRLQAHRFGAASRIKWMGYRDEVGKELAGLDLALSFSRAEGLPINLIEAGWAGTPVMCTRVGGVTDLFPDESYGELVPKDEFPEESAWRLKLCLSKEGQAKLLEKSIRFQQRVTEEFNQNKWIRRLREIYSELNIDTAPIATGITRNYFADHSSGGNFTQRLKTMLLSRLLLYPSGKIKRINSWNQDGFRIVMYHRFASGNGMQASLARQCAYIRRNFHVISFAEIAGSFREGTPLPRNALIVTVDDGYKDFGSNAFPVFQKFQIPVTVFLVSGFLDKKIWLWWDQITFAIEHTRKKRVEIPLLLQQSSINIRLETEEQRRQAILAIIAALKDMPDEDRIRIMNDIPSLFEVNMPETAPEPFAPLEWSDVRYMADRGVDFGVHTVTHPILSRLSNEVEIHSEISGSKRRIEEELNRPMTHFCYPNGNFEDIDDRVTGVLSQCGFETAVTTERGVNFRGVNPFLLRRTGVEPGMSNFNFSAILAGLGGTRSMQSPFVPGTQRKYNASRVPGSQEVFK
jgi:glycosyltransferase involved in cell wall biosynthesis/peptidoglycan/xylan/chitin deacetylase (PgdA/CDA1 family)